MSNSKGEKIDAPVIPLTRPNYEELAYLPPPTPFYEQEGLREKFMRKTKENPFVPLGVVFTTVVLGMGLSTLRTGNAKKTQLLMRLRVGGQAFAVFAMLAGVYYNTKGSNNNS
ncbi:HIG1 domain family member 2A, mitochondrial [Aplysia californica]|uniref:HIG1 domain family member 2A, mitochondrial n=1 Tax=Aplysia californica TaxID=6500 RepID=A0ABM0JZJ5_APLCA|nr:HIG1 domain family member 2A, mitochondrial [Aplysia californica]